MPRNPAVQVTKKFTDVSQLPETSITKIKRYCDEGRLTASQVSDWLQSESSVSLTVEQINEVIQKNGFKELPKKYKKSTPIKPMPKTLVSAAASTFSSNAGASKVVLPNNALSVSVSELEVSKTVSAPSQASAGQVSTAQSKIFPAKNRKSMIFSHTPEMLYSLKINDTCYIGGIGPVKIESVGISKFSVSNTYFCLPLATSNPHPKHLDENDIKEKGARKLMGISGVEEVLAHLQNSESGQKRFSGTTEELKLFLTKRIASLQPKTLIDIVTDYFSDPNVKQTEGQKTGEWAANEALTFLASEYATVKEVDFKETLKLFQDASGYTALVQHRKPVVRYRNTQANKPYTP